MSERDVFQVKKIICAKEKADNKDIIVIRSFAVNEENGNVKGVMVTMLNDRLEVNVEIRVRGKVIVAKLCNADDKEKVMKNKNKPAGSRIFIENFVVLVRER